MPVKLGSKLPTESAEARIEIVPLIDIMFFLLASFMLVSLSMVSLKTIRVSLPTAGTASAGDKINLLDLAIDKTGLVFMDQKLIAIEQIGPELTARAKSNAQLKVLISGDRDARHGDVIRVLDAVRAAGIDKVAFEISSHQAGTGSKP